MVLIVVLFACFDECILFKNIVLAVYMRAFRLVPLSLCVGGGSVSCVQFLLLLKSSIPIFYVTLVIFFLSSFFFINFAETGVFLVCAPSAAVGLLFFFRNSMHWKIDALKYHRENWKKNTTTTNNIHIHSDWKSVNEPTAINCYVFATANSTCELCTTQNEHNDKQTTNECMEKNWKTEPSNENQSSKKKKYERKTSKAKQSNVNWKTIEKKKKK